MQIPVLDLKRLKKIKNYFDMLYSPCKCFEQSRAKVFI